MNEINATNMTSLMFDEDTGNGENMQEMVEIFRKVIVKAYERSFDTRKYIFFTVYLSILSVTGTLSNLLVILVLHYREDCMELETLSTASARANKAKNPSRFVLNIKKKKANKPHLPTKPIYLLIQYLAIVDFLTCAIALPATIVEIWLFTNSNEVFCKLFEQTRASGVLLSNFLVILISLERFMLLCRPFFFKNFKNNYFIRILIVITVFSFGLATLSMFTLSVYQRMDDELIFVGICLPKNDSPPLLINALKITITSVMIAGIFLVKFLYLFIFKKALDLKRKKVDRKCFNDQLRIKAKKNSSLSNTLINKNNRDENVKKSELSARIYRSVSMFNVNQNESKDETPAELKHSYKLEPSQLLKSNSQMYVIYNQNIEEEIKTLGTDTEFIDSAVNLENMPINDKNQGKYGNGGMLMRVIFKSKKNAVQNKAFLLFKTNIRMALIIFFVTLVYYISVIPWCLTINNVIKYNPFIYYTFFINNAINPVIYGFFNPNFRRCCLEILNILFYQFKQLILCRACCRTTTTGGVDV